MPQANTLAGTPRLYRSYKCIEDLIHSLDFEEIFLSYLPKKYDVEVFEKYLQDIKKGVSSTQGWQEIVDILNDGDFVATLIKQLDQSDIILGEESINQEHISQIKCSIIGGAFNDSLTHLSNSEAVMKDVLAPLLQISSDTSLPENDDTTLNEQDLQEIYDTAREKGYQIKAINLPHNILGDIPSKNQLFKINGEYCVHVYEGKNSVYTHVPSKNTCVDRFVHGEDQSKMITIIDNIPYFILFDDICEIKHKSLVARPYTETLYFGYKGGIDTGEQVVIISNSGRKKEPLECFGVIMDNGVDKVVEREGQQYLISKNISPIMGEGKLYKQGEHELKVAGDVFAFDKGYQTMVYDIKNTKILLGEYLNKDGTIMIQENRHHKGSLRQVTDGNILDSSISGEVYGAQRIGTELFYSLKSWKSKDLIHYIEQYAVTLYDSDGNIFFNQSFEGKNLINVGVKCMDGNIQLSADQKRAKMIPNKHIDHTLISIKSIQEQITNYQKETSS